jgi:hypothetical protein
MGWKIKYSAVFLDFTFDNEILFGLCDCPMCGVRQGGQRFSAHQKTSI